MTDKLVRRGVSLTEEEWRIAKSIAARRGETVSEFFRSTLVQPKRPDDNLLPLGRGLPVSLKEAPVTAAPKPVRKK